MNEFNSNQTIFERINQLKDKIDINKLNPLIKSKVFDTESVKARINYNVQVLYSAALYNCLFKNGENVFKTKCKHIENFPNMFEIKANLKINDEPFELVNYYEMLYWNFFNVKTIENAEINYTEIDNNKVLFKLMDYIRRTR